MSYFFTIIGTMLSGTYFASSPRPSSSRAIPDFRMREFREKGLDGFLAPPGHAVVKVAPGGRTFQLYTLSTADESMTVVSVRNFS